MGNFSRWKLVDRDIVPGADHTSFRGESFAVLLALRKRKAIHLYIDCAAVVDLLRLIIHCLSTREQLPVFASPDIWNEIAWHIFNREHGEIQVTKIDAHQNWKTLADGRKRQEGFFSDVVDGQAKKSILQDHARLYAKVVRAVETDKTNKELLVQYHDFLCAVNDRCFEHKPQREVRVDSKPNFLDVLKCEQPFFYTGKIPQGMPDNFPYGPLFFQRFLTWWNCLTWGHGPPTSLLELYIDFAVATRTQVPVLVGYRKYHLRDQSTLADVHESSLLTQSKTWVHTIQWFQRNFPDCLPCPIHSKLRALHPFGYSIPCLGFPYRVQWQAGVSTADALWHYFHQGGKVKRSFASPWLPPK